MFNLLFILIAIFSYRCSVEKINDLDNKIPIGEETATVDNSADDVDQFEKIVLPIEVLGATGFERTVRVNLENPSTITHLYLRCNHCGFQDKAIDGDPDKVKAQVRINNGPLIDIKHYTAGGNVVGNRNIKIHPSDKNHGGIGGALRSVRFTLPVKSLKSGINKVSFIHAEKVTSIGFRILEMNFLRSDATKVLADSAFMDDDPKLWRPPHDTPASIARGKELYSKRNHLYDFSLDRDLIAACGDCHAADGRDLAYFNYSNLAIAETAIKHALSRQEGELIASYIRSIDLPVVSQARPWNPPYQPGPGLDDKPVYEWAAGAGLDAVLDSDQEMKRFLFPDGVSKEEVTKVVDRYSSLNMRELPIAIPLAEWNQWLPKVHPMDAFNSRDTLYQQLYSRALQNPNPKTLGAMLDDTRQWLKEGANCFANGKTKAWGTRSINGTILRRMKLPRFKGSCSNRELRQNIEGVEIAKNSLLSWVSVKWWEIIQENKLEEEGAKQTGPVCSNGRCIDPSEKRGWVMEDRTLFERVPHFLSSNMKNFSHEHYVHSYWSDNAWYHLNMVVNTGYRRTMPSHFTYTLNFIERFQAESDVSQSYRYWATMIKMRQLQTNGRYGVEEGLDLRTAQPYAFYSKLSGKTDVHEGVGRVLWKTLITALLEDFIEDANNATPMDWASATNNSKVQPRSSRNFSLCRCRRPFKNGATQGTNTYRVIPKYRQLGISDKVLSDLIDWGQKTWPRGRWDNIR